MKVITDAKTFEFKGDDRVFGIFYISHEGIAFPSTNWDDFVSPIALDWAAAVVPLAQGSHGTCSLHFMDGPYTIHLARQSLVCTATFEHRPKTRTAAVLVDLAQFLQTLSDTLATFSEWACRREGLSETLQRAQKFSKTLRNLALGD